LAAAEMGRPSTLQGPGAFPSMYFDFVNGRRIEVEALQGAAVRMGKEVDVPTPLTFAAYALLKPYENGAP
jgi:2-dehydropantoate 2-reductase